ncbi:DUF4160 domain-containing protein [uncultured Treponema sp.]|uniref:DUF4160 domain-containing protein n=1 Tax=Treponema sp. TaxID=166 RepID=UPI002593F326|nr:DUF4160 domain-containing protein [uncultured Treponema sp.]
MPQIFRIGSYIIYFWVNEGKPIEPIHVHVSSGEPCENSTKIWITKSGKTIKQNNRSRIPEHQLNSICRVIEYRSFEIIAKWKEYFGEVSFYC